MTRCTGLYFLIVGYGDLMLDSGAAHEGPRVLGVYCHFSGMSHLDASELVDYFITSN
jgi:hypothetical protein